MLDMLHISMFQWMIGMGAEGGEKVWHFKFE